MQAAVHNKVKVYNLTSGKSLPEWLTERKKGRPAAGEQRLELIHDLEFPDFARCIFRTANGSHLFAAGDYPPRIRCFDVNQLSMKFSFNADMPILSGVSLSPDYRKFALRGEGRVITVHNTAVIVDRLRVPHVQRCLTYHENTCDLLSGGVGTDIVRFNLDAGSFTESFVTKSEDGVNTIEPFTGHGLIMAGCENGLVEAWDPRSGTAAGFTNVANSSGTYGQPSSGETGAITHVSMDSHNGLLFACGTSTGQVALYDIRLNRPLVVKDHMNGLPIVKTYFFQGRSASTGERTHVLSADTRSVKVWNKHDGSNFTTLEAPNTIFDFVVLKSEHNLAPPYEADDSGIICLCCDTPRVQVQFVPQLGVAPKWASFLDGLTEELEQKDSVTVYEDYKFIAKEEMERFGISAADVTDGRVRPAMHGCYIENKLYRELKAVVDPSGLARFNAERSKAKAQQRREERISSFKRLDDTATVSEADKRFAAKLKDPAFAVDERSKEYSKLLHVLEEKKAKEAARQQRYDDAQFRIVGAAADDDDDEDGDANDDHHHPQRSTGAAAGGAAKRSRSESSGPAAPAAAGVNRREKGANVIFQEARDGAKFAVNAKQAHDTRKQDRAKKLSLADRLAKAQKGSK